MVKDFDGRNPQYFRSYILTTLLIQLEGTWSCCLFVVWVCLSLCAYHYIVERIYCCSYELLIFMALWYLSNLLWLVSKVSKAIFARHTVAKCWKLIGRNCGTLLPLNGHLIHMPMWLILWSWSLDSSIKTAVLVIFVHLIEELPHWWCKIEHSALLPLDLYLVVVLKFFIIGGLGLQVKAW